MASDFQHQPVLLEQTLSFLNLAPGSVVVDGTLGGAGHASAILARTAPDGVLIGLDVDDDALAAASSRLAEFDDRAQLVRASFRELDRVLGELEIDAVDGVLLDLGVSSHQLDLAERGFRFASNAAQDTPLDMRMDRRQSATAADLLRHASQPELEGWFRDYGELRGARRLARAIVEARRESSIETTADLMRLIRETGIGRGRKHNPATLVFQALRIAVNDELGALREGLDRAIAALRPGGRLVVIAYHSLEDRISKNVLRAAEKGCLCPPELPVCICGREPSLRRITRKPIGPGADEVQANPRSRSARLRAAERLPGAYRAMT